MIAPLTAVSLALYLLTTRCKRRKRVEFIRIARAAKQSQLWQESIEY